MAFVEGEHVGLDNVVVSLDCFFLENLKNMCSSLVCLEVSFRMLSSRALKEYSTKSYAGAYYSFDINENKFIYLCYLFLVCVNVFGGVNKSYLSRWFECRIYIC